MKKIIVCTALIFVFHINAVFLRNGVRVQDEVAQNVWRALSKLEQEERLDLLTDLWITAGYNKHDDMIPIYNRETFHITEYRKRFIHMCIMPYQDKIAYFNELGFCDEDGFMTREIAHIVDASIEMFHGSKILSKMLPKLGGSPKVRSPLHPLCYAYPKYWFKHLFSKK